MLIIFSQKEKACIVEKVVKFLACIVENSLRVVKKISGQSGGDNWKVSLWKTRVPLPLPLPLPHIGWYHGSTHTDTNFFFEVGN